jgi:beta-mannosidase
MFQYVSVLLCLVCSLRAFASGGPESGPEMRRLPLECAWQFRAEDGADWRVAQVPGCVHTDLLREKLIADPLAGSNAAACSWVTDKAWVYQSSEFDVPAELHGKQVILLRFSGLDTYATVWLNGERIIDADNAFRYWEADVRSLLRKRGNRLVVRFKPVREEAAKRMKALPYSLPGGGERAVIRKPQYQFGGNSGPSLPTYGITGAIEWLSWDVARFENVYVRQDKLTEKDVTLTAIFEIRADRSDPCSLFFHIPFLTETYSTRLSLRKGMNLVELPIRIEYPRRWWCNGQGEPFLYDFSIELRHEDRLFDRHDMRYGIRTLELVNQKDSIGESFCLKLNGVPVFAKGANMVPLEFFPGQTGREDYEAILRKCRDHHFNLIRVWGGGAYEQGDFYELCDEMGIMVWQDFMFAGSMYPADSLFITNVMEEAHQQTRRLRNHACMAVWCGNSEVAAGWEHGGWQNGLSDKEKTRIKRAYDDLFTRTLRPIVKANTQTSFVESSPRFGSEDARCLREGDCHDLGDRPGQDLQDFLYRRVPRFMSGFGIRSYPSAEVLRIICGEEAPHPDHPALAAQRDPAAPDLMDRLLQAWYPGFDDRRISRLTRMTQVVQAEGVCAAIEAQRRAAPRCMGSLIWQLNDAWPALSWSCIDYAGKEKLVFSMLREAFAPKLISYAIEGDALRIYFLNDLAGAEAETLDLHFAVRTWEGTELYSFSSTDNKLSNGINLLYSAKLTDIGVDDPKDKVIIAELRDLNAQTRYRRYGKLVPLSERLFVPVVTNGDVFPGLLDQPE